MFLESIKLFGFKSFVNKTEIKLADGITGILGPNGCGKSNVADAVRWVLGEQSVKQLRGASMEDVIFKGTRDRKPLGMAEVVLKMRNDDGAIPIDYRELSIGRRLYRSGVSEYLLNKTPCRLKDLRGLFLDSGLGVQAYAIFERQMIDEILNETSTRRREMFEEASGIMKYKMRRKEALRKLEHAERDLQRLGDLMSEIEREVRSLSRQVGRARRYRRLKEETRDLDVALGARRLAAIERERGLLERELRNTSGEETGVATALRTGETDVERLRLELLEVGDQLNEARHELAQRKEAIAAQRREAEVLAERREGLRRDIDRLTSESEVDASRALELSREADSGHAELERMREAFNGQQADLGTHESALADLEARLRQKRETLAELQQLTLSLREAASQKSHELARHNVRLEEISRRRERLQSDRSEAAAKSAGLEERLSRRREELAAQSAELGGLREESERTDAEHRRLTEELNETTERARDVSRERASVESRLETLEELRKSYEGYDDSVRGLLLSPPDGVLGPLAGLLDVPAELSPAVDAALGDAMQGVVVRDGDTAVLCLRSLSRDAQGRVTLCPIDDMSDGPSRPEGVTDRSLADLVSVRSPDARSVVEALLGRTFVVDTVEEARERSRHFPGLTWVTPAGEAFHDDRRISGGGAAIGRRLIQRESEIARLSSLRATVGERLGELESGATRLRDRLEELDRARTSIRNRVAVAESLHVETTQAIRHLELELNLTGEEIKGVDSELVALEAEARDLGGSIDEWQAAWDEAAAAGEARAGEWERLSDEVSALGEERESRLRTVGDLRVAFAQAGAQLQAVQGRQDRLLSDRSQAEKSSEDKLERSRQTEEEIGRIESRLGELSGILAGADDAIARADRVVQDLSAREAERRNAWAERDQSLRAVRDRVNELRESAHRVELKLNSLGGEGSRIRDRVFEEYGVAFIDELDERGIPLIVRHERRRPSRPRLDPGLTDPASVLGGERAEAGDPGSGNGSAHATGGADAGSHAGVPPAVESPEGEPGESETDDVVAEVVVSQPMPADPPRRYADLPEAEWPQKVAELREKFINFGPVNEMAVEDYETQKERLDFLVKQRDDLNQARTELLETIRKVNREARERFQATFVQAQENFKQLFELLFPGGVAELKLENEDPLEGDIIMVARPRGKRVDSIKLLSSGERALTAIALLFSVYMIKPSPFCILDEVDAPLDDANIGRYVTLIREFSKRTQFIMITHNKRTMEACDDLYGVTMEEAGVSKIVSVRLHEGTVVLDGEPHPDFVTG